MLCENGWIPDNHWDIFPLAIYADFSAFSHTNFPKYILKEMTKYSFENFLSKSAAKRNKLSEHPDIVDFCGW